MDEAVEYKILEKGKKWEEIPVFLTDPQCTGGPMKANEFAAFLSRCHNAEVRWNYADSSQGHYVGWGVLVK